MANEVKFEIVNQREFQRAMKLAPILVRTSIRREFKRVGDKFANTARRQLLDGSPGIHLPARQEVFSTKTRKSRFVKLKSKERKVVQRAHIRTKVSHQRDRGSTSFLVAYASRFLEFHERRIRQTFEGLFRLAARALPHRVQREATRITQQVLDRGLRDRR
ncbi:MAG: hypothetical protein NPIRA02_29560 [Nitrospirales bacterium]|nr:MAG: hypothetical protein NPIRA02_29560 [Nitrospirales bacterium]